MPVSRAAARSTHKFRTQTGQIRVPALHEAGQKLPRRPRVHGNGVLPRCHGAQVLDRTVLGASSSSAVGWSFVCSTAAPRQRECELNGEQRR